MGKYSRSYIGRDFITNEGYKALVINGSNRMGCCIIRINKWISEVGVKELKNGKIKYPYHKNYYGVGFIGVGKYKHKHKACKIWSKMIERCYRKKRSARNLSYIDCKVCNEWLDMQVFSEWYDNNYIDGFELDKDLLVDGNKIYSPETCTFIPQELNKFLSNVKSNNTSGYIGVSWHKSSKKWQSTISDIDTKTRVYLGLFDTPLEASMSYQKARAVMADRMREKMISEYNITDSKILDAIR